MELLGDTMSDEINRTLGELVGTLKAMQKQLEDDRTLSTASRKSVYERLDAIHSDSTATAARVKTLEDAMKSEVLPVVRAVVDWKSRIIGAVFVIGALGTAIVFAVTYGKDIVIEWIRERLHR
jgi:hypothetical protein